MSPSMPSRTFQTVLSVAELSNRTAFVNEVRDFLGQAIARVIAVEEVVNAEAESASFDVNGKSDGTLAGKCFPAESEAAPKRRLALALAAGIPRCTC